MYLRTQISVLWVYTEHGARGMTGKVKVLYAETRQCDESKPPTKKSQNSMDGITKTIASEGWTAKEAQMSFFKRPIMNKQPMKTVSLSYMEVETMIMA